MNKKLVILILILILLLNLGIRWNIWDNQPDIYKDEEGRTYPLTYDSFAYLNQYSNYPIEIIYLIPLIFTMISIVIFFLLCKNYLNDSISLFITFLFSVSISFMANTLLGLVDKNPIIFTIFISIVYFISLYYQEYKFGIAGKTINSIFLLIIFFLSYILFAFLFIKNNLTKLIDLEKETRMVSEMQSTLTKALNQVIFFPLSFLIISFIYATYYTIKNRKVPSIKILYILFSILLIVGILKYKFFYLALPFAYIFLGLALSEMVDRIKNGKYFFHVCLCVLMVVLAVCSIGISGKIPVINDNFIESIDYVNTINKSCILNFWSYGSIYNYYTNKTVFFHSHPNMIEEQYDYFVYGKRKEINPWKWNCIIIFNQEDYFSLAYLGRKFNKEINSSKFYINSLLKNATLFENNISKIWVIE